MDALLFGRGAGASLIDGILKTALFTVRDRRLAVTAGTCQCDWQRCGGSWARLSITRGDASWGRPLARAIDIARTLLQIFSRVPCLRGGSLPLRLQPRRRSESSRRGGPSRGSRQSFRRDGPDRRDVERESGSLW